jgi:outer membrane protein assembly factor BamB
MRRFRLCGKCNIVTAPIACSALFLGAVLTVAARGDNWTRFRGENGTGQSSEHGFSPQWSTTHVAWTADLPGIGHSSPVVWGDKLFITSSEDNGLKRYVLCLDARLGNKIWSRTVSFNASRKHPKSSYASSTPAVDGERVYVVFADAEHQILYAYDFEGNAVWQYDLGSYESQHAQGSSPVLFEDLVILANDQDGPSSLVACDKRTGKPVWSVERKSGPQTTAYSTPLLYQPKEGPAQLICSSGASGVSSYDPRTGKRNWTTNSLPARTVASPVLAGGLIFQCCGGGGQGKAMVAIDPGGHGDVSKSHIRYERTQILPYVPTPVSHGNYLFLWGDHGIVSCMDQAKGKDVWTKRVGGEFSSSPICINGMLLNVDERGNVTVLAAAPQYKQLGKFSLNDPSHSTPAVANGRLYFRTFHHLACVEAHP